MKPVRLLLLILAAAVLPLGCVLSPFESGLPTRTPTQTLEVPTRTPAPPTPVIPPTLTPEPPTPVPPTATLPPAAFSARVLAVRINLREGPSTIHTITGRLYEDNQVSVLAKAPGDEWLYVETAARKTGWLAVSYLFLEGDLGTLPEMQVKSSFIIEGEVKDDAGTGINGVNVAVYQEGGSGQQRTDAVTRSDGRFFAYLPLGASGSWMVEIVGVSCQSWIMDTACRYHGSFSGGGRETIQPPLSRPLYFIFQRQSE